MKIDKLLELLKISLPCCLVLAVLIFVSRTLVGTSTPSKGNIEIKMGDGISMKIDIENNQVELEDIIKKIEENSEREEVLLVSLKSRNIFKINDSNLANALKSRRFSEKVSKEIRELWKDHKGPFDYNTEMRIIVDRSLSKGKAKVCSDKAFLKDNKLMLINTEEENRSIDVEVDKHSPCEEEQDRLNISPDDARNLATNYPSANSFLGHAMVQAIFVEPDLYLPNSY